MRLLIITQKADKNDSYFGFFHKWIIEFSKNFEEVLVICLYKGETSLPSNVRVLSLGKEIKISKISYLINFYRLILKERKNYDVVFVHMNQIYVVLGGLLWQLWRKPVFLWYVHKNVSTSLRIAEKFLTKVFTASKESFRLKSEKVKIVGHGIDTEVFKYLPNDKERGIISLVTLGRISPVKNIDLVIDVVSEINKLGRKADLTIIGDPGTSDQISYLRKLEEKVKDEDLSKLVKFIPGVPHGELPALLVGKNIFLNFSNTGSIDKAVLEAYFTGLKVLTTNEAFKNFPKPISYSTSKDPKQLAPEIISLYNNNDSVDQATREQFVRDYGLSGLIQRISGVIKSHE